MADGPRCKRRKQANPKRSSATTFNNGLEASSDSDDEDKLHIVEEDSLHDTGAGAEAKKKRRKTIKTVLKQNGDCNGVKENGASEEEEEEEEEDEEEEEEEEEAEDEEEASGEKDALVEEMLQQGDTAIIYPEAPEEEELATAETGGADENGTPEHPLHICPYCSRGYKRNASLKEHIKYRHETSEDNYSCSHCSYTFTYRSQLERHMSHHRSSKGDTHKTQRHSSSSGGSRRFKCTTCSKAFKYKHHLKEHLRIHSGEKPYECGNCMKRFSHSGSYSSHISSKKCVAAHFPNGLNYPPVKPSQPQANPVAIAPAKSTSKDKMDSKPLQEQLPVTQIKTEPEEEDIKPVIVPPVTSNGVNGASTAGVTLPPGMAMVVPTLGLVSPITLNMNDLQNVLKVAMDNNVLKQILGNANGVQGKQGIVVQQPQQQILSLPAFVDHDGTTKIIINYSVSPTAATTANTQPTSLVVQNSPPLAANTVPIVAAAPVASKTDRACTNAEQEDEVATDLSIVKEEPDALPILIEEGSVKSQAAIPEAVFLRQMPKSSSCLLCDECPEHLEALHLLQHRKAANGEAVDSDALDPSFADLLSEAGVTLDEPSPTEDVLSVLKTSFSSNAHPSDSDLEKIAGNVSIPVDIIRKWFTKMNNRPKKCEPPDNVPLRAETNEKAKVQDNSENSRSTFSPNKDLVIVKSEPDDPENPLKSEPDDPDHRNSQEMPLDLSLPKSETSESPSETSTPPAIEQPRPLNLACINKDLLKGRALYVTTSQTGNPVNIVTATQIPTLVAIAGQGGLTGLSAINTTKSRTIIIPQLAYTYAAEAGKITGAKAVVLNGHKEKKEKSSPAPETVPPAAEKDSELDAKRKKFDLSGVYPCDLCSKVFQKGSSLLRHKYEHTGKRPHECIICKKAFKHKHHLIEHARLHTGIKPYQCDKCGKRFSHSGSYSQHMNHRYSYCRRMISLIPASCSSSSSSTPAENATETPPDNGHNDSGSESPEQRADSQTASEKDRETASEKDSVEDEEEDDEDDEDEEEAMTVEDIRVVQVDDMELGGEDEAEQEEDKIEKSANYKKIMDLEFSDCEEVVVGSEGDSQEKMEEDEKVEDCDKKNIREGSDDEEPTAENAK